VPWDDDLSPPDLFVDFGFDPGEACVTSVWPNDFEPQWDEYCDLYAPRDPNLYLDVWEADAISDVWVTRLEWRGADAFVGLARQPHAPWYATDPTGTVTVTVEMWPTP
jgi:hypothetical protein